MTNEYIQEILKQKDKKRYFLTLIIDKKHQQAVQALYAFNAEISAISHLVKEPNMGKIRLTYWREILEGEAHGEASKNPIASAILRVLKDYNLPSLPLIRLIDARRFDLYNDKMPDMKAFELYSGETTSILFQYVAMMLNDGQELSNGDGAGHLGVADALIGHVMAFEYNLAQQKLYLPLNSFGKVGLSEQQLFADENKQQVRGALINLLDIAQTHLAKAENATKTLARHIRPAFALIKAHKAQIKALKKSNAKDLHLLKKLPDWKIIWHIATYR